MAHSNSTRLLLLLGILFLLFSAGTLMRDLTWPDELRYAEVAREMRESGNWFLPTLNYKIYPDKPPVFFWLLALSQKGLGETTTAALLPSICSGLLLLYVTFLLGRELYDEDTGLLSAWICSTFLLFLLVAQVVRMDLLFTLLITTALYWIFGHLKEERKDRRRPYAGYLLIGLALVTKGPVGLIVPVLAFLPLLMQGRRELIRRLAPGRGILLILLIPLLWLVPAALSGGKEYLTEILFHQSAGRLVHSFAHAKPFYYYFMIFPVLFLPWSPFLLLYGIPGVRDALASHRQSRIFLLSWIAGTLLFFSLVSGKIAIYLLPIMPGLSILIGRACTTVLYNATERGKSFLFPVVLILTAFFCIGGAVALLIISGKGEVSFPLSLRLGVSLIPAAGGVLLVLFAFRNRPVYGIVTVGLTSILLSGALTCLILPRINPDLSLKPMAEAIQFLEGEHPRVAGYKIDLRYLAYYLHTPYRKLNTPPEINKFLRGDRGLLIADLRDIDLVRRSAAVPLQEVGRFRSRTLTYLLLKTKQGGGEP
ncbi:MAG: glycosyltransferase family 39 protein [Deltaproteobacteria bacterium]|nr:glycosyltransferase family 39 protein [Deltaproteobacteria bacterium]